ncbi:glycosyl transferase group 1 [Crinalium epipsammum PCC 9333]|uniref:Glycosyl transferase group 1 n=1 Tax=Crinalium epipsammum PCC 9333 TaxID=1173022 RepID=K9W1K5_9CYAN|nr:glycosyltransferase family 4 protein [Crinalium epipsammum]AFZ13617.1 glycosyl transferase group 1 [Crinalium epipsammum PCC 9333]
MKICIVTPAVIKGDGQGRANYEIVWEAIRRGYHLTLLARNVDPELEQNSQVNWVSIPVKGWSTALLQEMVFSWQSAQWLQQHRLDFDLIQVYGAVTSASGDINTVQFVHSAWLRSRVHISRIRRDYYGAYQWLYTALNSHWEKQAFRKAKVVVAVSERVKQELMDIGVPEHKLHVIYNGVDVREFSPGSADRRQIGLPENATIALFAGDIRTNRKNLDTVLHALVYEPELHLAVVGSIEGSPYPNLVAQLGLTDRVHFMGYRRDLPEIMRALDLFVFPSRYEPFGMVVSEAMAAGLPVITSGTTGAAEIVTPESGVVLSDSEDIQGLAEALTKLGSDRELRRQMGIVGRAIAEQHSWVSKANSYMNLFEEIVKDENQCSYPNLSAS